MNERKRVILIEKKRGRGRERERERVKSLGFVGLILFPKTTSFPFVFFHRERETEREYGEPDENGRRR